MIGVRLSVGIPAYNQGQYLGQAIESLLAQTVRPLEIVVSDNHSTDNTSDVISRFGDKVKVIRPTRHMSAPEHLNFLISNLRGEWVSLLSSDDVAKPNYVSRLYDGINMSEKAVLVRSGYEVIDGEGTLIDRRYILSVKKISPSPENIYEQLEGPKVNFAAFAVKKDVWLRVGGFPESIKLFCDWAFWLLAAQHGEYIYVRDIISQYRTKYRPTIEKDRLMDSLADLVNIYELIIPRAFENISNVDINQLYRASKARCLQAIARTSQLGCSKQELESAVSILQSWADATQCSEALNRLRHGDVHYYRRNLSRIKSGLRTLYQLVARR